MKAQVESISPVKTKFFVEISAEEIGKEEDAGYRDLQRRVTVPGFRKGKAPVAALRRAYSGQVRSEALSRVIQKTYGEVLEQHDIHPVSDAEIELQEPAEDGAVAYTAVVEVRPTVEPRGYEGLELVKERVEVSETEVEARLETIRREHAVLEPAAEDWSAQEGDVLTIDYEGTIDGTPFEGGRGEDRTVAIGSGLFVPGFEDGLLGARGGEERTVEVDFPEDYRATDLAGRHARFQILVKDLKTRRVPDLDDEFARDVAKVADLAELRERTKKMLEAEQSGRAEQEFRERVIDALLRANPFEVPDALVRQQQARALEALREDLSRRGLDLEKMSIDQNELQENYRRGAERSVRWAFLLRALAEAEALEVTEADVEERLRAIAEADGRSYTLIRGFFEKEGRLDSLRSSLLEGKVIDRIVSTAKVEEKSRTELEASGGAQ